jgi:hypothetical protein
VAGCCEHGNEPWGSIKYGEFLDRLSVLVASQGGPGVTELVCFVSMPLPRARAFGSMKITTQVVVPGPNIMPRRRMGEWR